MQRPDKIDFAGLLGFETVAGEFAQGLDFKDETFGDKLGAKIGPPEGVHPIKGIDFQDETLGAKLGAKVGEPETR